MARLILMEQIHINIRVPRDLSANEPRIIRRTLDGGRFRADLRRAVGAVFDHWPALARVRVTISR